MSRRILITGLSTYWGGRLAQMLERDPANEMGERFFGPDMTNTLIRALWGGDRQLPRPLERG